MAYSYLTKCPLSFSVYGGRAENQEGPGRTVERRYCVLCSRKTDENVFCIELDEINLYNLFINYAVNKKKNKKKHLRLQL